MYKDFCMDVYLGTIPFVNTRTFSFFATFTSFLCRFQKHEGKVFLLKMMLQTSGCDFFPKKNFAYNRVVSDSCNPSIEPAITTFFVSSRNEIMRDTAHSIQHTLAKVYNLNCCKVILLTVKK